MNTVWMDVFDDYSNSNARLKEVLQLPLTIVTRDSSIKRFELTFELSWKLLKSFLKDNGYVCTSPKSCLQEAFSFGLIQDDSLWFAMMNDRNSSVHTYDEAFADAMYKRINGYLKLFQELEKEVKKHL